MAEQHLSYKMRYLPTPPYSFNLPLIPYYVYALSNGPISSLMGAYRHFCCLSSCLVLCGLISSRVFLRSRIALADQPYIVLYRHISVHVGASR